MAYMINATVDFKTKEDRARFVPLQQAHKKRSLANEAGTLRFDFSLSSEDDKRVLLQELYESREAFDAHWNGDSMKTIFGECEAMGIETEINGLHGVTVD